MVIYAWQRRKVRRLQGGRMTRQTGGDASLRTVCVTVAREVRSAHRKQRWWLVRSRQRVPLVVLRDWAARETPPSPSSAAPSAAKHRRFSAAGKVLS